MRRTWLLAWGWVALLGAWSCGGPASPPAERRQPPARPEAPSDPTKAAPSSGPEPEAPPISVEAGPKLRYIAVGGGATPEYTEVSLEQDIELAMQVIPGPGAVLFAGGRNSSTVRTLDGAPERLSLLHRLGELFDPRAARDSRYRKTRLPALPASLDNFESTLKRALAGGSEPLLVYIATHGLQGNQPRDNHVELWGAEPLDVVHLDELSAEAARPVRFVIASCYSGGFAELAFKSADAGAGVTAAARCGLFAGTWDRQTSGCDPNPDRRAQEGYSLHVLQALRSQDRAGQPLPIGELDLDGDGKVSLLEAHTRARIASHSIDVPTTTSERYLREVEKRETRPNPKLLPEDAAVLQQLGARLELTSRAAAEKRFKQLGAELDKLQDDLDANDAELDKLQGKLGARLLSRWPVLNDPFHDEFSDTLERNEAAIAKVLDDAPESQESARLRTSSDALAARTSELDADEAVVLRLLRAYETLGLAAALYAHGGSALKNYQRLLACERSAP